MKRGDTLQDGHGVSDKLIEERTGATLEWKVRGKRGAGIEKRRSKNR